MEIIGTNLTKRNSSVRNRPTLPNKVIQSQRVGKNIAHVDGVKSRFKLVITITKRSIHIPILMKNATTKSVTGFRRTVADQSACGTSTLQTINTQKTHPYGPNARLNIMYRSKMSPLYHAMNASMK